MKQSIFSTLLAIAISAVFVSCSSSDDYSSPLKKKTFSDITFDASSSSNVIQFGDADLSKISAKSSDGWCKVSVTGSAITVSVDANDSYGERSATVTITDSEDGTTANFKAIQKQNDAILVDKNTYEVGEEGGVVEISVQSNVSYNVDIIDADWITRASNTRGLEKSTITLNVAKNTSGDVREATVKISDSSSGESSLITIKQAFTPQFNIDKTSLNFDENGGEDEVTVISNVILETSLSENWVEIASKDAKDDNTTIYKLKVKALGSDVRSRKADITFTNTRWNISEKVTITQTKSLYIEEPNAEIYVGDNFTLSLVNNLDCTVLWESSDTSVATVDNNGIVTGVGNGSITITVTSSDGKYSDKITITIKDIQPYITSFTSTGMTVGQGSIKYTISCFVSNDSDRNIVLKKCTVYRDGYYVDSVSLSTLLPAGLFDGVTLSSTSNITAYSHTFLWEYEFNGKIYSLECDYRP